MQNFASETGVKKNHKKRKMDLSVPASKELQTLLDKTDRLREKLSELKNPKLLNELFQVFPQFAVLGNQSAGKSSLLRRISKTKLLEANKRCTRIAILLKLRRGLLTKPRVILKGPEFKDKEFVVQESLSPGEYQVENAVREAQDFALGESSSKQFVTNLFIEVEVTKPTVPNVTLIDLPGFFDPNEEEKEIAEEVVRLGEKYIQHSGTLILNVVGADQDYGNAMKKEMLAKATKSDQNKVTLVLTKVDLLANQGGAQESFESLLEQTRHCDPKFIVLTNLDGEAEKGELDLLKLLSIYDQTLHGVQWGIEKLNLHLEAKIASHLQRQVPLVYDLLKRKIQETEQSLEYVLPISKTQILLQTRDVIFQRITSQEVIFKHKVRERGYEFCEKIKQLCLRPLEEAVSDEEIRKWFPKAFYAYKRESEDICKHLVDAIISDDDPESEAFARKYRSVRFDITKILMKRGLENLPFVDPQIILERYMSDFSERYAMVLCNYFDEISDELKSCFEDILKPISLEASKIIRIVQNQLLDIFEHLDNEKIRIVEQLKDWNQPPNVYTVNEHYLHQTITLKLSSPFQEIIHKAIDYLTESKASGSLNIAKAANPAAALEVLKKKPTPSDEDILKFASDELFAKIYAFWKTQVKLM